MARAANVSCAMATGVVIGQIYEPRRILMLLDQLIDGG